MVCSLLLSEVYIHAYTHAHYNPKRMMACSLLLFEIYIPTLIHTYYNLKWKRACSWNVYKLGSGCNCNWGYHIALKFM